MVGTINSRKQSRASGHLLIVCTSNWTFDRPWSAVSGLGADPNGNRRNPGLKGAAGNVNTASSANANSPQGSLGDRPWAFRDPEPICLIVKQQCGDGCQSGAAQTENCLEICVASDVVLQSRAHNE